MMTKTIEKNMYLRRRQGKVTILWCQKNTDNLWFCIQVNLLWCPKNWKIHVLKTSSRQTHINMMPKKYRTFTYLCKNHNTMMPEKYWKKHVLYLRRRQGIITIQWYPKNSDYLWFFVKITILWRQKILKKTCF